MQTSITHLPKNKQTELNQLVKILREHTDDLAMVILFGSYARGEFKEEKDLQPNRRSGHASDYDILVITGTSKTVENSSLWQTINEICLMQNFSAAPRIIVHAIQEINIQLAQAHYFYTDIKKEGCLLYSSGKYTLAEERELYAEEKKHLAQKYFDSNFLSATDFFELYEVCLEKNKYTKAAFLLNQATEMAYKTILHVFNNYIPHEHSLTLLSRLAERAAPQLANIFPKTTKQQQKQFQLLDYAYIGARYDMNFNIQRNELLSLAECVKMLLAITEKACKEKIANMDS